MHQYNKSINTYWLLLVKKNQKKFVYFWKCTKNFFFIKKNPCENFLIHIKKKKDISYKAYKFVENINVEENYYLKKIKGWKKTYKKSEE